MVGGEGSAEWRGGEAGGGVAVRPGEWGGKKWVGKGWDMLVVGGKWFCNGGWVLVKRFMCGVWRRRDTVVWKMALCICGV